MTIDLSAKQTAAIFAALDRIEPATAPDLSNRDLAEIDNLIGAFRDNRASVRVTVEAI